MLIYALICALICASAQAQSPPAQGSIESILAIDDPAARIAALQKFLETNNSSEQAQTAREAIVTSRAQIAEGAFGESGVERALENFRRAIAELPELVTDRFFDETVSRIPFALSARGYRTEAVEVARRLENRFSRESRRLGSLGEFYMTIEAPADAIRALEAATKLTDEDAKLRRMLGAAYRLGLRLDEAIAEYQLAISFDANDKRAYYELGNLYRAHGAYADAIRLYRRQLEIDPKHSSSYKGLALAYLAQGNEEQTTAALNQARDLRGSAEEITGDIYLQTQLAFYYLAQGKLKEAQKAVAAALLIEPRYSWARIAAAEVDLAGGKYFEAERNLIAARTYASFPTLYFTLGKLYLTVEDFDGALEQFSKAFNYSPQGQFTTRLGGVFDAQADNLKDLLSREHQAAIFLAEPPTKDETFRIAESLVRFDARIRGAKTPNNPPSQGEKGKNDKTSKTAPQSDAEAWRRNMEELDRAAMDFIETENTRRSFRTLHIAERLAQSGVAPGLALELAEQALGLAEAATEPEGSLRDYPNYDRQGRLSIFRGRALSAKGWALFKADKNQEAVAALTESTKAYGALPEGRRAMQRLATVKETQGDLKEALDLYIAAYETPMPGAEMDVNRAVIELLYRKVNGSLEGLDKRLGVTSPPASSVARNDSAGSKIGLAAKSKSATSNAAPEPKPTNSKAASEPKSTTSKAASEPKPTTSKVASETKHANSKAKPESKSASAAPESKSATESTTAIRPDPPSARPAPRVVEFPAVGGSNSAIPSSWSTDFGAILSTFKNDTLPASHTEEPAPPTPRPVELPMISDVKPGLAPAPDSSAVLSMFGSDPLNLRQPDEPPPAAPAPQANMRKRQVTGTEPEANTRKRRVTDPNDRK
jgi:tetratricopeptide (TPR) repeat protein